jgi:riboflavin transporter FmnP
MPRNNKAFLFGFIPALILPLLFMGVFIHFNYSGTMDILRVIIELFKVGQLSALLAVGAVPNLLLFMFAMNRERWQLGRGVIAATLFYAVIVMVLKWF